MTALLEALALPEQLLTSEAVYAEVVRRGEPLSVLTPSTPEQAVFYGGEHGVTRTPLEPARRRIGQHPVSIKPEYWQESGAFKSRGARSGVLAAKERDPDLRCVSTASAGNHALGVQQTAGDFGLATVVECPTSASMVKVGTLRGKPKTVVHNVHPTFEGAADAARLAGEQSHIAYIPAFDDLDVLAGQFTLGEELMADLLELPADQPVVLTAAIGGGGEITGIACALRKQKDQGRLLNVRLVGVQMEGCDAMNRAVQKYRQGEEPTDLFAPGEFDPGCDGTAVQEVGKLTLPVVADRRFVDDIVVVSRAELARGMHRATEEHGRRIEPAGALSMAGALVLAKQAAELTHFVTVTCGANVTAEAYDTFMDVLREEQLQRVGALAISDDDCPYVDRKHYGLDEVLATTQPSQGLGNLAVANGTFSLAA